MNKYIFSLTTIPLRIDYISQTIDSLINQTLQPDKIILHIPKQYNIRFNNSSISNIILDNLKSKFNNKLIINIIDNDYGPGTKFIGLLHNNIIDLNEPNTYIVLVDDDVIYKSHLLSYFDKHNNNNINTASYCCYMSNNLKIGQGVDGFFIKPKLLKNIINFYNVINDYDIIKKHDDYYLSYYFHLNNISITHLKLDNNELIYNFTPLILIQPLTFNMSTNSKQQLENEIFTILDNLNKEHKLDNIII